MFFFYNQVPENDIRKLVNKREDFMYEHNFYKCRLQVQIVQESNQTYAHATSQSIIQTLSRLLNLYSSTLHRMVYLLRCVVLILFP